MDIASLNIKVTNTGLPEANAGLAQLKGNAAGAAKGVDQFEASSRKGSQGASAFAGVVRGLSGAIGGLSAGYLALKAINMADQWTLIEGRVRQSTRSIEEADYSLESLIDTAKETGASVDAAISIFQRISFVRDEIQATNDEMLQFTETVQKLGVVSGASQDAMKFGLTQLGQSLSSDIVRAEEFNSIMENIPAVGKAIADELGVTTGQLRLLVIEGKLLSEDVFAAVLNSTEKARAAFEAYPETVGRAFSQVLTQLMETIGGIDDATGASEILIAALVTVGKTVEGVGILIEFMAHGFSMFFDSLVTTILSMVTKTFDFIENRINNVIDLMNHIPGVDLDRSTLTRDTLGFNTADLEAAANDNMNENFMQMAGSFNEGVDFLKGLGGSEGQEKVANTREISRNYADIAKSLKEGNDEEAKAAKKIADTINALKFRNEQLHRSTEEQELYNQLRAANVELDSIAGRQIQELVLQYDSLKKEQDALNSVVDAGESAFKRLWDGATDGATSWRDVMSDIVGDVSDMFYDLVIKSQIQDLFKSVLGMPTSGSSSGFSLGNLTSAFSGVGDFFGGLFGFADGGSFKVGGVGGTDSQLVAFKASPDETVSITKPGQSMGGESAGGQIVYNIDARGADAGVEERLMRALQSVNKSIEGRALNAVNTQFKRDPTYGKR